MRKLWERLDRPSQVALVVGVALAVASVPLATWLALIVGLCAALALGYVFPRDHLRVGVLVAAPVLSVAFLLAILRGIGMLLVAVVLACSLVLPVALARIGANARTGPTRREAR